MNSLADAQLYCGTDGGSGTQTPWHGRAGEGWHPPASAGCSSGVMSSSQLMQRAGASDVCFTSVDQAKDRWAIYGTEVCASEFTRFCRTPDAGTVPSDAPLCVCATSDPYASDGRN
jgi:hypothetical protein